MRYNEGERRLCWLTAGVRRVRVHVQVDITFSTFIVLSLKSWHLTLTGLSSHFLLHLICLSGFELAGVSSLAPASALHCRKAAFHCKSSSSFPSSLHYSIASSPISSSSGSSRVIWNFIFSAAMARSRLVPAGALSSASDGGLSGIIEWYQSLFSSSVSRIS